jgi:hypothetical protein
MAEGVVKTPYSTAMPYVSGSLPDWLDPFDAQRIASYDLYDEMFRNSDQSYALMLRDADDIPIYIPIAKKIINTLARYVGRGWNFSVSTESGEASAQEEAKAAFSKLFRRERMLSKFTSGKKEWLRRGDWVWMITADPDKPEGKRISVSCVDPRTYFPIISNLDASRTLGVRLIEQIEEGDDTFVKVQRWLKPSHPEHPNFVDANGDGEGEIDETTEIAYDRTVFELEDWDDPEKRETVRSEVPLEPLPGIHNLPIYNLRNNEETDSPFGSSDLSGIESIISGVNQAISDEDEALAIAGLGMYVTDSGAPVDAADNPVPWQFGPRQVVEIAEGATFVRVEGIDDVQPIQDHVKYLERNANATLGVNDVALGETEGSVQISGIALSIKMQPLFDAADEKDQVIEDVMNQMFHDLREWFAVYEGIDMGSDEDEDGGVQILSVTNKSDRLPFDREGRWKELMEGVDAGIFTPAFVLDQLRDHFGYEFPAEMLADVEKAAETKAAQADAFAARAGAEVAADEGENPDAAE